MPHRNLITIFLAAIISFACYHTAQRNRYASTIGTAMSIIEERALEPKTRRELFNSAMNGMMDKLDEHSRFLNFENLSALEEHLDQEFGGVGFIVEPNPETGELVVVHPVVDTPAYRAGISAGDVILAIDGKDAIGLDSSTAVSLIKGAPGSKVTLTLRTRDNNETRDVPLVREIISIESVVGDQRLPDGSWSYILEEFPRIGYLRITEFGEKTADEIRKINENFPADLQGLVIDLRGNSGGLLESAVEICDMFLDQGTIVTIKSRDGQLDRDPYMAQEGTIVRKSLPMAILIDGGTASASEIFAACLQDHKRATVVGERSYGKGTVQQIIKIDGGRSALKLTVSSYWRPSGRNIHRLKNQASEEWGVEPDIGYEVPLTDAQRARQILWQRKREYPETILTDQMLQQLLRGLNGGSEASGDDANSGLEPLDPDGSPDPQLDKAIEAILKSSSAAVAIG